MTVSQAGRRLLLAESGSVFFSARSCVQVRFPLSTGQTPLESVRLRNMTES